MQAKRQLILDKILQERLRQLELPGSEWDLRREPNDWLSIAGKYLFENAITNNQTPLCSNFEDSLVQSAAVILAALEHIDVMKTNNKLRD